MAIGTNNNINTSAVKLVGSTVNSSIAKITNQAQLALSGTNQAQNLMNFAKGAASILDTNAKPDVIQERRDASTIYNTANDILDGANKNDIAKGFEKLGTSRVMSDEAKEAFNTAATLTKSLPGDTIDGKGVQRLLENPQIASQLPSDLKNVFAKDLVNHLDKTTVDAKAQSSVIQATAKEKFAYELPGQSQAEQIEKQNEELQKLTQNNDWINGGATL